MNYAQNICNRNFSSEKPRETSFFTLTMYCMSDNVGSRVSLSCHFLSFERGCLMTFTHGDIIFAHGRPASTGPADRIQVILQILVFPNPAGHSHMAVAKGLLGVTSAWLAE